MRFLAIKVAEDQNIPGKHEITPEMVANSPVFETEEEASNYCNLINPDGIWAIMPEE